MRSARRAIRPRHARACSSGRSSAGCPARRSRRSRSWRTSGRARARTSHGCAASRPTASSPGLLERGLIAEAGRDDEGGAVRYRVTPLFERVFGLEDLSALPRLDDLADGPEDLRGRLELVASQRSA